MCIFREQRQTGRASLETFSGDLNLDPMAMKYSLWVIRVCDIFSIKYEVNPSIALEVCQSQKYFPNVTPANIVATQTTYTHSF